ncbi:methyl-accepting chemotaxis protein [Anaerocolumna xylanovorans]|uniref:Methyl-accepting chemotaxis protein n=1 Tax=Anaerocolumna xylanovorans DSM 12503 TaxID=1121345 RepID=A0A1M7XZ18_9FIRM|nr:methyl-accepting chemotaxis protein [Anaerocolumna xylanovorans]SHO44403.1 methyl-accepting chemotaxis protein [Anaerocolumna xylanovorans DSM 12503]
MQIAVRQREVERKKIIKKEKSIKKKNAKRIRGKLIGAFAVPVILIVLFGIAAYQKVLNESRDNYEMVAGNTIRSTGNYFDLMLTSAEASIGQLAASDKLADKSEYGSNKGVHKAIITMLTADEFINQVHIFSAHGVGITTKAGTVRQGLFTQFAESKEGKTLIESGKDTEWAGTHEFIDGELRTKDTEYGISFIKQVKSQESKVIAYIVADIGLSKMQKVLKGIDLGEDSISAFITSDGREISGQKADETVFLKEKFYKKALTGTDTSGSSYVTYKGTEYLFVYAKVEESGSMVCGLVPETLILKQANDIKRTAAAFVLAACIIAVFIGNGMAKGIGKTIRFMAGEFKKASAGDLTGNIVIKRKDEFSLLADASNQMLESMRMLIRKAEATSTTAANSAIEMTLMFEKFYGSTKDITKAIGGIERGAIQQARDTAGCLNQMSVLSDKVGRVYENTGEIERDVQGTIAITENGLRIVDDLGSSARATTDITGKVISNIEELSKKSGDIENIVSVINSIAGQTTLLSLNASIEASRAGFYGKGFGVVAEEIRELAERSLAASKSITEIIKDIQSRTVETAHTAKEAQNTVKGQTEAIHRTIGSFHDISSHVEHLNQSLLELTAGIQEIEEAKKETYTVLENISTVVGETATVAEQIYSSAGGQLRSAKELSNAANKLKEDIAGLDESINSFIL